MMLVVHPSLPVTNLKEFIAHAKANPKGLDYASSGPGTSTHLAGEMFKSMAGVNLVHVPFKGNAEVYNSLLGGHIKVHFSLVPSAIVHVRAGKLRAIAVASEKRLPYLPDLPTIAESGFPAYEISSWQGVLAPAGTRKRRDRQDQWRAAGLAQDAGDARAHGDGGRRSGRQHAGRVCQAGGQ